MTLFERYRGSATSVAGLLGLGWATHLKHKDLHWSRPEVAGLIAAALIIVLLTIKGFNRVATFVFEELHTPTPSRRTVVALALSLLGTGYLLADAYHRGRLLIPFWIDEHMYLLQARMLASGRLWMPAHALPQFFETFCVFVRPVYAAAYFPGTALAYVPAMWLHLPVWTVSIAVTGAILGFAYLLISELVDGLAGIAAVFLIFTSEWFRFLSLMPMSHPLMLLLGILMVWSWLRWRKRFELRWGIVLGIVGGWAAITRPIDAACFAVPLIIATAIETFRHRPVGGIRPLLVVFLAAMPLLALQLIMNIGVTGSWSDNAPAKFARQYWPTFVAKPNAPATDAGPRAALLQLEKYRTNAVAGPVNEFRRLSLKSLLHERIAGVLIVLLPSPLLVAFIPVGLLDVFRRRRWVLACVPALLVISYSFWVFFFPWYTLVAGPALFMIVLLGSRRLFASWPSVRTSLNTAFLVAIITGSVTGLPSFHPATPPPAEKSPHSLLAVVHRDLAALPEPSLVLFRFTQHDPEVEVYEEPVYNLETADPDQARVIRAQDLGVTEDRKLIDYYAHRQPRRQVYLFLRRERRLVYWGRAVDLATRPLAYPPTALPHEIG